MNGFVNSCSAQDDNGMSGAAVDAFRGCEAVPFAKTFVRAVLVHLCCELAGRQSWSLGTTEWKFERWAARQSGFLIGPNAGCVR